MLESLAKLSNIFVQTKQLATAIQVVRNLDIFEGIL